jgi:hypothetical protein
MGHSAEQGEGKPIGWAAGTVTVRSVQSCGETATFFIG